jgi:hypothetical protein
MVPPVRLHEPHKKQSFRHRDTASTRTAGEIRKNWANNALLWLFLYNASRSLLLTYVERFLPHSFRQLPFATFLFFCVTRGLLTFKTRISTKICNEDGCTFRAYFDANEALLASYSQRKVAKIAPPVRPMENLD